jgi:FKBP-type peptidyl-prolyl cis-trans isomerase FkpA
MTHSTLYTGIAVALAIAVVALFFFFPNYLGIFGMNTVQDSASGASESPLGTNTLPPPAASDSLVLQDVQAGTGDTAQSGDLVAVEYVGKLADGTIFDQSSAHPGIQPGCNKEHQFCFTLGAGQVIPGWDQGVLGMKEDGVRTLVIPPSLAYGAQGVGPIPPNATLTFEVKLVSVNHTTSSDANVIPIGPNAN